MKRTKRHANADDQAVAEVLRPWHPTGSSRPADFASLGIAELRSGTWPPTGSKPAVVIAVVARRHRVTVRRRLRRIGYEPCDSVLMIPGWPDSEHLLNIGSALPDGVARHLGRSASISVLRWLASRSWGRACVTLLAPSVGTIATADPTLDRHGWLAPQIHTAFIVHSSRRPRRDARTQLTLLYRPGTTSPVAVVKFASDSSGVERIERERRALVDIGQPAADAGVVVPLLLDRGPDHLVMSAIAGRAMDRLLGEDSSRLEFLALDVLETLGRWQVATVSTQRFEPAVSAALLSNRLASLTRAHPSLTGYAAAIDAAAQDVIGRPTPTVAGHGDLTAANVVRSTTDGALGFLDWESATTGALPGTDDWYFAVDAVAVARCCSHADAVEFLLTSTDPVAVRLLHRIRRSLTSVGAGDACATLAFHATWIGHAHNELVRGAVGGRFAAVLHRLDDLATDGTLVTIPRASSVDASTRQSTNAPTQR